MPRAKDLDLDRVVADEAREVRQGPDDYDALFALIGNARFVLLGEATHGTHEFYRGARESRAR